MTDHPAISVIIPAYNAANSLEEAVSSVLAQSFENFEVIIVNDGSADKTPEIINALTDNRIRAIHHPGNQGAAAARNSGIAAARGHYVAFLDADDLWLPEKLLLQYTYMTQNQNPDIRASCTSFSMVRLNKRTRNRILRADKNWNESLFGGCHVSPGSTLMAERALFAAGEVGPLPADIRRLEDWDWLLTYIRRYKLGILEPVLSTVRVSGYPAYDTVRQSARMLYARQITRLRTHFGPRAARRFHAGLQIEMAGTAFRKALYGRALWHVLAALCISPGRVWTLIKRLMRKLKDADYSGLPS